MSRLRRSPVPAAMTRAVGDDCCYTLESLTATAVVSDNCDPMPVVTQMPAIGSMHCGHNTVVAITLTATDASGNMSECSFELTLKDITPPSITCPADMSVSVDAACEYLIQDFTLSATTSDNCDATPTVTQLPIASTVCGHGTVQSITLTATDDAGNMSECSFTLELVDRIPPAITCPANGDTVRVPLDTDCDYTLGDFTMSTTTSDNCQVCGGNTPTVAQYPSAGNWTLSGHCSTVEVLMTATDDAGNTATCTFTVKAEDVHTPTITCQINPTLYIFTDGGACSATVLDGLGSDRDHR